MLSKESLFYLYSFFFYFTDCLYFNNSATTHTDLILRAREMGIPVTTIHNTSIINAVGVCGLQLYNFGQTISIPFFTDTWRPDSFYDRIKENRTIGLHTLCLLGESTMRLRISSYILKIVYWTYFMNVCPLFYIRKRQWY